MLKIQNLIITIYFNYVSGKKFNTEITQIKRLIFYIKKCIIVFCTNKMMTVSKMKYITAGIYKG